MPFVPEDDLVFLITHNNSRDLRRGYGVRSAKITKGGSSEVDGSWFFKLLRGGRAFGPAPR